MKNWGWKSWLTFAVFILICVGAATVILVGKLTEGDPDLMTVCWTPSGSAQYIGGGWDEPDLPEEDWACEEPEALVWPQGDHLKLVIVSNTGEVLDGRGDESLVVSAFEDYVNQDLDTHIELTMDREEADIVFLFRRAFEVNSPNRLLRGGEVGGYCVHTLREGRLTAEAAVFPAGNTHTEIRRSIHELGHCMGLRHWREGMMRAGDLDDSNQERMDFRVINEKQQDLIRRTYPE